MVLTLIILSVQVPETLLGCLLVGCLDRIFVNFHGISNTKATSLTFRRGPEES